MRLTLMYFSPTHTTKKVVSAVGKVFFEKLLCETRFADITSLAARMREYAFGKDDVLIFGAPVYGGRVPPLLLPFLAKLRGGGARAVALSVYGNRDYDDALAETCGLLEKSGFTVCAAAAFIGEHSYSCEVGRGRPDAEDILAASTFALAALEKTATGAKINKKVRGGFPYKEYSPFMTAAKRMPAVDAEKCSHCGACISVCPVCNIAADLSDQGRCIACAACVKFCARGARAFIEQGVFAAKEKLEKNCTARRTPEFFI